MSTLADAFNNWLSSRYDPARTQSGEISRRGGLVRYPREAWQGVRSLLGGSYSKTTIRSLRQGDDVPARLRQAVERIVELGDPEAIRARLRDEALSRELRHGQKIASVGGTAPDGGDLESWARQQRKTLDATYDAHNVDLDGEAAELWEEIVNPDPQPTLNRRRRKRAA